jgi:tetratricopeptide (TPR) repeat protein
LKADFTSQNLLTRVIVAALLLSFYPASGALPFTAHARQTVPAQANERERGVALYQEGDAAGAITSLQAFVKQSKNDIRAWHYLGLALERTGGRDAARKAHEKAAKIASKQILDNVTTDFNYEKIAAIVTLLKPQLAEASESAEKYLKLSSRPSASTIAEWRERLDLLQAFTELSDEISRNKRVYKAAEVTTKALILSKPSPEYTDEARHSQVTGTVTLFMIFAADGKVKAVIPVLPLPYGLTGKAIEAARGIKFNPAIKDGQPVSQFMRVEYIFNHD